VHGRRGLKKSDGEKCRNGAEATKSRVSSNAVFFNEGVFDQNTKVAEKRRPHAAARCVVGKVETSDKTA